MYRVLIVDDEFYVVTLIEHLVDWEAFGMEVVGKAFDGKQALEKVWELLPEIVIVDICMPEYDGITLMQKIREINTYIKFIVISGHKKFEYAKSAIQYDIEDYMLKPIDKEELETILFRLREKLESETIGEKKLEVLDQQLSASKSRLRETFMDLFTSRMIVWNEYSMETLYTSFYVNFRDPVYKIILIKLDIMNEGVGNNFLDDMMGKVTCQFREATETLCKEALCKTDGTVLTALINYAPGKSQEIFESYNTLLKVLDRLLRKFENIKTTIVIGNEFYYLNNSDVELKSAQRAMAAKVCLGCGRIISVPEIRENADAINEVMPHEKAAELREILKDWEPAKMRKILSDCYNVADALKNQDNLIHSRTAFRILKLFYEYLHQAELYKDSYEVMEHELTQQIQDCVTSEGIRACIYKYMEKNIKKIIETNQSGENPSILLAKKYIASNYNETITLAMLAGKVSLSRVYFSILFKKETGVNFLEYLTQYRVEASKELLKEIHYNLNEVAEKTGFQDGRYYSKVFKKIVGISPSEYRSRHTSGMGGGKIEKREKSIWGK